MTKPPSRRRFPLPGPTPKVRNVTCECERDALAQEIYEWEMQRMIHYAVHTNNPEMRADVVGFVRRDLLQGAKLAPASVQWLVWILGVLQDGNNIPHLAGKGNAINTRARVEKIRKLVDYWLKHPELAGEVRMCAASTALGMSYSTIKSLVYTNSFKAWLAITARK
jgi:hypothetical protein